VWSLGTYFAAYWHPGIREWVDDWFETVVHRVTIFQGVGFEHINRNDGRKAIEHLRKLVNAGIIR